MADGVLEPAPPHRAQPVEDLDGRRQRDHHGREHEGGPQGRVHARLKHVMAPDDEPQPGDPGDGEDHRLVAKERLARKGRDDVRNHPHARQDHHVNRRVRIKPEQVLEQERPAAPHDRRSIGDRPADRAEEVGPHDAVQGLHDQGRRQDRQRERLKDRRDEHRPHRHRHPEHLHPRRTQHHDRRDVVDRAQERRDPGTQERQQPERLAVQRARRRPAGDRQGSDSSSSRLPPTLPPRRTNR